MKNSDTVTFSLGSVSREASITRVVFNDSAAHDLADARSLMDAIRKVVSRSNALPMLTDVRATSVGPSKEAREFYSNVENAGYSTCSALLCASAYQKILGNFTLMFSPPLSPTRIFMDEEAALAWCDEYRNGQ